MGAEAAARFMEDDRRVKIIDSRVIFDVIITSKLELACCFSLQSVPLSPFHHTSSSPNLQLIHGLWIL